MIRLTKDFLCFTSFIFDRRVGYEILTDCGQCHGGVITLMRFYDWSHIRWTQAFIKKNIHVSCT